MISLDLNFPVFDDTQAPPPVLDMDRYSAWVHEHWRSFSAEERERIAAADIADFCGTPFRLHDDENP